MPLGSFKVVMSMTDEGMLHVKLGKMKHVTTLEWLLSLELNLTFYRRTQQVPLICHPTNATRNLNTLYAHAEA